MSNAQSTFYTPKLTFISRGNRVDYDFDEVNLIEDTAWHDLDLSAIVPITAKLVFVKYTGNDNAGGKVLRLREKGFADEINAPYLVTQAANRYISQDFIITMDANGFIQYLVQAATWNSIGLLVRGWFVLE